MSGPVRLLDQLVGLVAELGNRHLFGVLGDANMFFVDEYRRTGGRYVAAAEEKAAVLMATGYARRGGRPGVVTVTHGPGLANTVAALVDAERDKSPVLVVAGETPPEDPDHLQWLPQRELVEAIGVTYLRVDAPGELAARFAEAVAELTARRGPVVLGIPSTFMFEEVVPEADRPPAAHRPAGRVDEDALDAALGILATSRRGILLAGRGATGPGMREVLLQLAEAADLDVATTLLAKDFFAEHPRDLGVFGTFSTASATERIARADCIVALGASLNRWTTADATLLSGARLIAVDDVVDPAAGAWARPDVVLRADAGDVAALLTQGLRQLGPREPRVRPAADLAPPSPAPIDVYVGALDEALPRDRTVVCDGGRFMVRALHGMRVADPRALVHTLGFGSIGLGLGNAVGAAVAAPEQPTVLLVGDGGLMLAGWSELHTIVRERLDVTIAVFNDAAYGAEHQHFVGRGLDPSVTEFDWPSFAEVASGFGWATATLESPADAERIGPLLRQRDRPTLLDLRLDPLQVPTTTG
ncbi:thiamine pyrophosphate-binding protein [Nocardioides marmoriginsengisoli]|uniref:thiamine pyrophosphate-binding protein n=1 Tax=Nocardioides marmoriginsengisoli TaxID=661483 RepID=UPI00161EAAB5|nr:thiamine pyrophosphate-dependent enzyme [Nocardioides marmoriginsengisoli]